MTFLHLYCSSWYLPWWKWTRINVHTHTQSWLLQLVWLCLELVSLINIKQNKSSNTKFTLTTLLLLWFVPEAATVVISLFRTCAIKPSVEKMTNPAKMLVPQLISEIIIASLYKNALVSTLQAILCNHKENNMQGLKVTWIQACPWMF